MRKDMTSPLQMFVDPLLDSLQRLLNVFHRVGHAEADIALSKAPEGRPRKAGSPSFFEECIGQILRLPSCVLDVGKDIERARGPNATESLDLVQAVNHE